MAAQEREELAAERCASGNNRHALQQWLIRIAVRTVTAKVDHNRPSGVVTAVFEGAVDQQWVVQRSFAAFQLDRDRFEMGPLHIAECCADCVHISGQASDRQQVPPMALRYVLQATVVLSRIVKPDPAG